MIMSILEPWHYVKPSSLHGTGVFAARDIPAGTSIMEYEGKHISNQEADEMEPSDPNNPFHTFFFSLSCGKIIDGGDGGNESRFINHSCAPNCEGHENSAGTRVFIVALRDIAKDEELLYDYALVIDDDITPTLRKQYQCLCNAPNCRGTMLALPEAKDKPTANKSALHKKLKKIRREQKKLRKHMRQLNKKLDRILQHTEDPV